MSYSAEDYEGAIRALLPRGRVWMAERGSAQQRLILALAQGWARLDAAARVLLDGSLPGGNLDLVPEWEATLGLPDPCAGEDATLEQRAVQVLARFIGGGGQSVGFFKAFAAALGFEITISYVAPFRVEAGTVETPIYEEEWLFAWFVTVNANSSGLSNDVLFCELNAMRPAHTYVLPAAIMLTRLSLTPDSATIGARIAVGRPFDYLIFFASSTPVFADAAPISGHLPDNFNHAFEITETGITAWPRYYWAVSYSAGGAVSDTVGPLQVAQPLILQEDGESALVLEGDNGRIQQEDA